MLIVGSVLSMMSVFVFGMVKSVRVAAFGRWMFGFFNGNVVIVKMYLGEMFMKKV